MDTKCFDPLATARCVNPRSALMHGVQCQHATGWFTKVHSRLAVTRSQVGVASWGFVPGFSSRRFCFSESF